MKRLFFRGLAVLLILSLLAGCASRTIYFSSIPEGALVEAGSDACTTPCAMKVAAGTPSARFTLPNGENKEVGIAELTARDAAPRYGLTRSGEVTLGSLAVPLLVGGGVMLFIACLLDGGSCWSDIDWGAETDNEVAEDAARIGAVSMAAGGILFVASDRSGGTARELRPEVRASFVETPLLPAEELLPLLPRNQGGGTLQLFPAEGGGKD